MYSAFSLREKESYKILTEAFSAFLAISSWKPNEIKVSTFDWSTLDKVSAPCASWEIGTSISGKVKEHFNIIYCIIIWLKQLMSQFSKAGSCEITVHVSLAFFLRLTFEIPGSSMCESNQFIASSTPAFEVLIAAFSQWWWLNPIETSWETISSFGKGLFDSNSSPGTVN